MLIVVNVICEWLTGACRSVEQEKRHKPKALLYGGSQAGTAAIRYFDKNRKGVV